MHKQERGVALIMVILVLLVLTVLGITAVMLMTQEDRISSRQDMQKAALYAAEAGLRHGEAVYTNTAYGNSLLTAFLTHTPSSVITAAAPDPIPSHPPLWDNRHLGTYLTEFPGSAGEIPPEIVNREILQRLDVTNSFSRFRAYYTLYVRNNPEDTDPAGNQSPLQNFDPRLRLISVGFVTDPNGVDSSGNARVLAVKILEEEFTWSGSPQASSAQKLMNAGGTSSGLWAGSSE